MSNFKKILKLFITLLFFLKMITCAYANNTDIIIKPVQTPVLKFIDTYNFHKIDNFYYRGGQPDNDDFISFALLGIKTVINLRNVEKDNVKEQETIAEKFGINYINIPMKASEPPTSEQISYFLNLFNNPKNLPVYVHCWQGKDRTGIMTALYRVKRHGWSFDQAYAEMKQKGYHSIFFPKHKDFLYNYTKNQLSQSK